MDVDLPDYDLRAWMHHLPRYFRALHDRFPSEGASTCLQNSQAANNRQSRLTKTQVQQDPFLRDFIAPDGDDGGLSLAKIENGAQVLRIVQNFMRLALAHPTPATTALGPSTSQSNNTGSEPGRGQQLSGHTIYTAVPFSDSSSQIRLIELLPGHDDDPIDVRLLVTDRGCTQYEALSYVWGSRDADKSITVDGKPFEVSANLAEAFRCLRHKHVPRVVWIDAICINQTDDAEKSAQVAMMGDIYRNAVHVLIFLGGDKDDSELVMEYLELVDESERPDVKDYETKKHVLGRLRRYGIEPARFLGAVDAFFKRPWWIRVWTVQEFVLGRRDPLWCCGRRSISSPRLRDELIRIIQFLAMEARPGRPGTGSPEILADPRIAAEGQFAALVKTSRLVKLLMDSSTEEREALPLTATLTTFQFRESTDARDYIYALREMLSPIAKHVFVPDYSITADELFGKASSYLILFEDRMDALYAMYQLRGSPGMPSWALDFAQSLPLFEQGVLRDTLPPSHTSGGPAVLSRTLRMSGVILDSLDAIMPLEAATSDMEKLELLWRAQSLLWHRQPSESVPEVVKACIPGTCLLPLRLPATNPLTWSITLTIPGFASFCLVVTRAMVSALLGPRFQPENLTCQKWEHAPSLSPSGSESLQKANALLIEGFGDPETFYAGACFDHDNLKAKILGVKYRQAGKADLLASIGKEAELHEVEENTAPVEGGYVPQYAPITSVLHEAAAEGQLQTIQDYLLAMARQCREIFNGTVADVSSTDPPEFMAIPGLWHQHRRDMVSSYHEILNNCSCGEGDRDVHQMVMRMIIDRAKDIAGQLRPVWEQAAARVVAVMQPGSIHPGAKVVQKSICNISSIFTTRWGFTGFTFQRLPGLRKGDVLAVLDGMPAPVVLEEMAHGAGYRLKALVNVHGIKDMDIDRLTELRVCVRREFDIV